MLPFRIPGVALLLVGLATIGCGEESADEMFAAAEAAAAEGGDRQEAARLFSELLQRHPRHGLASQALKHLAMLDQQAGDMRGAIARYNQLLREYPGSDQADEAQFMIAFIYEEHLGELDSARVAYQRVIDNYPASELVASARRLLPNVGRDPEDWVEFQDRPGAD